MSLIHSDLTGAIIGAAIEVHRELGPGLLESAYEQCLSHELHLRQVPFQRQLAIPVEYKEIRIDCCYRIDLLVDYKVVVELKSLEQLLPIHKAQLLTYMKLSKMQVGLLINFNVPVLRDGIERMVL
jgi:GxxExxY protein